MCEKAESVANTYLQEVLEYNNVRLMPPDVGLTSIMAWVVFWQLGGDIAPVAHNSYVVFNLSQLSLNYLALPVKHLYALGDELGRDRVCGISTWFIPNPVKRTHRGTAHEIQRIRGKKCKGPRHDYVQVPAFDSSPVKHGALLPHLYPHAFMTGTGQPQNEVTSTTQGKFIPVFNNAGLSDDVASNSMTGSPWKSVILLLIICLTDTSITYKKDITDADAKILRRYFHGSKSLVHSGELKAAEESAGHSYTGEISQDEDGGGFNSWLCSQLQVRSGVTERQRPMTGNDVSAE
ncbi:hypothetical protein EDD15DRAFT_2195192 [Pisolithus albus]|nr:hypothetical protein EDD15DRAFT_2195192 [Pisolithus albus]